MERKAETKHGAGVCTALVALHLSMLIVGAQYSGEEHCKLEASKYIYDEFHLGLKWITVFPIILYTPILPFCQNGTFEPVHEIQNFFGHKTSFEALWKYHIQKIILNFPGSAKFKI